jgi:hypothetical protein
LSERTLSDFRVSVNKKLNFSIIFRTNGLRMGIPLNSAPAKSPGGARWHPLVPPDRPPGWPFLTRCGPIGPMTHPGRFPFDAQTSCRRARELRRPARHPHLHLGQAAHEVARPGAPTESGARREGELRSPVPRQSWQLGFAHRYRASRASAARTTSGGACLPRYPRVCE